MAHSKYSALMGKQKAVLAQNFRTKRSNAVKVHGYNSSKPDPNAMY